MTGMRPSKQVEKSHYEFGRYLSKERWSSVWHQLDEVYHLRPQHVLEIGPGPGVFKVLAEACGIHIETLDLDPELKPDHVASATAIPLNDGSFDVVCAFQVLEHLPYEASLLAFREMSRVSRRHVVISLPDAKPVWRYEFHIPRIGLRRLHVPRPFAKMESHGFDGEHYWEINKRGYPLPRIVADFTRACRLLRSYRVPDNPYHRIFVFERSDVVRDRVG